MKQLANIADGLANNAAIWFAVVVVWIGLLVVSLWAGHRYLVAIPPDYFMRPHRPLEQWQASHSVVRWTFLVGKNLLGALMVAAGIIMLFTPGQGLLAILLGASLLDIPGKRALERRVIQRPNVLRWINRLRTNAQQPPLEFPQNSG